MYSLDFAAQVSRICMDEIRRRGKSNVKKRQALAIMKCNHAIVYTQLGLRERKILRKSGE